MSEAPCQSALNCQPCMGSLKELLQCGTVRTWVFESGPSLHSSSLVTSYVAPGKLLDFLAIWEVEIIVFTLQIWDEISLVSGWCSMSSRCYCRNILAHTTYNILGLFCNLSLFLYLLESIDNDCFKYKSYVKEAMSSIGRKDQMNAICSIFIFSLWWLHAVKTPFVHVSQDPCLF